jgi:hypothetical protein
MGDASVLEDHLHPPANGSIANGVALPHGPSNITHRPDVDHDVIIIGTGFGGIRAIHEVRKLGFTFRVFERGSGVGGAW